MKKYLLIENYGNKEFAGSKATTDIIEILTQNGYVPLYVKTPLKSSYVLSEKNKQLYTSLPVFVRKILAIVRTIFAIIALKIVFKNVEKNSAIFIQFPFCQFIVGNHLQAPFFKYLKRIKKCIFFILIHDLNSLRYNTSSKVDLDFCSLADALICHTESMKKYLVENGIDKNKIKILNLFDYLTNVSTQKHSKDDGIVFAGNLKKSYFLRKITLLEKNLKFNLYGIGGEELTFTENIIYKGVFPPNELPGKLQGGFGLVWEGDSFDGCSSPIGLYQKYNSPHKASLYVVSRLPIICWKESALCRFIEDNNLGFGIDSLYELRNAISSISQEKYNSMLASIDKVGKKLEHGNSLLTIIKDIEEFFTQNTNIQ